MELGRAAETQAFQAVEPFTLACRGSYSLMTNDKKHLYGTQSFKLSVSPKGLTAYMFDWDADGYLHGPHKAMNETIQKIDEVTADAIRIGGLEINRNTLKYTAAATDGKCEKAAAYVSIPGRKI